MKNTIRSDITIENLQSAVNTLENFLKTPIEDDRDRAGIIQAFEFCYELAWVALKKIAEDKGLEAPTPLDAFQAGFQMGFIEENEQKLWLEMKKTRNLTSHTYKEELAGKVLKLISEKYLQALKILLTRIKSS